nr:MAG TPA: DNA methylase [Caudoviricetes sp.]
MAWDWLKDNNDEPNEFKPIDARGLLNGKEYHDYWTTKLHNGLANVPKSLLGAVESIPAMAARTRPVVMQELENDLDGTGLMDSDADKEALSDVENQIKGTTAPIWEGARLGVKAAKDALPDANWESNVDESQLSYPKKIGGMILENAPLMAAQLGASIINPALGVALMAGSIAGDAYNDLTEKGVDPLTAGQAGWLDAAAQAPLEGVGEMGWLKAFRELGTEGAAKLMGKAFVKEGLTEAVQEFPDETIPYIAEHGSLDGFDWGQLASNAVDAGVVGGIYGGGFAGIGRAINGKAQPDEAQADNGGTPSPSPAIHAMNRLVNELGIDPKAASGIVGGLMLESGGNTTDISTTAENPESGAYGIGQWTGPRKAELMAFAEETGGDPNDLDTQISFLIHELKGSENGALQEILKAQSPDEAGRLADKFYERSEGTDKIRNQKATNSQTIYDMFMNGGADPSAVFNGGKAGGSSVPNPKSAEDFLKDLEETLPADTDEDVEKLNDIRKAIQGKNKKAQEELAAQYGWGENAPETAQDASEGVAQENVQAGNSGASKPINSSSSVGNINKKPEQSIVTATPTAEGKPQAGNGEANKLSTVRTGSPRNEGANLPVAPGTQTSTGAKSPVAPSIQSTPLPASPTLRLPPANATEVKKENNAQVPQAKIGKARSNQKLKELVKQAFVDGDKDALARLGAMQINPDILEAVKNDVLSAHQSPLTLPAAPVPAKGTILGTAAPIALPPVKATAPTTATVAAGKPTTINAEGESAPGTDSNVKSNISEKENNHENTEKNQPVHHSEENKNDNAKPEQSKPSESKDRKTPEGKNPVKNIPSKETPSSGKKEAPQKTNQKQDDKVVVRNNAADNDARDAAKFSKEIGAIGPKASNKAKAILKLINKCLIHHRAGNSTSAETIARIRFSLRGKNFAKLPEAVKAKLNEYAERKIKEMQVFDKEHPWAEKEATENEDAAFDEAKDAIDRIAKMLDNGVMTLDEAIERANKVAGELEDAGFSDAGSPISHAADRVRDYFNKKIASDPVEAPKTEHPKGDKDSEPHNEKGSEQQPTLADGYTTESGRLLSESDARDFIVKPDGSKEFGHFGKEIEDATGGKVLAKGIRLQVGFSRVANGKETGFGIIHIKKRESQLKKLGYNNAEEYILDIINNFSIIYDLGGGRIKLASVGSKFNVMPLDLELKGDGNGYYTVVTAIPKNTKRMQKEAGKKIFDRSASPSSTTGNGAVQDGGNRKNAGSIPQSATEKSNLPASTNNIDETLKNVNNKPDLDLTTGKSIEASKGEEPSTPKETVFGSVEDADKDLEKAFGLKPVANTEQTVKKAAQEATGAKPSKDEIHKKHRLVDDSDEAIQGYIEEFISKTRNLNAGFDPTILVPVFKICAAYTQRGITKFADFASKTIAAFKVKGVKQKDIEPWLAPAWEAVKSFPDTGKKFDAKKLVVALKAVGARYESGLKTADAVKDDIRSKYGDKAVSTLNDYIDASFRGVEAYFNKGKVAEPAKKSEPSNTADRSGTDLIDYAFNQGGIIRKDVIQNMSPEDVDTVSKIFDGGDKSVDSPQENDTIEEGNSNVVSTKEDKDVRGRKSGSGRPVEVGGSGKSSTGGKGEQRTTRGNSETPDRDGGRERGPDAESTEPKNEGTGGSRELGRGQAEDGTRMERANGEGTSAGGAKRPVISPKADKVETDIAKGKVKDARDVPGNDYIAKPVPPDAKGASKTQRVDNNITAIKLLKKIESENRMATPAEQEILAGYSGWGGLGSEMKSDAKRMAQLKELLTEEEYNAAERELLTAFYTPPFVISRMWELAEHLGFKGGRVLDPSCGVGSFFSLMPASLRERSTALQGVELSPIPARIAKQLYQSKKFKIDNQDYTKFDRGNGFYDLAITNVPFSNSVKASVPAMRDSDGGVHKSLLIHDYYFAQTLDKVRPGGLIVFMTSSGTMDRKTGYDNALLRHLSSRAKLVGIVRLPNTLFAPSANVGTDIVVFRKLNEGENPDTVDATNGWTNGLTTIEANDDEGRHTYTRINGYYEDNPDNIIGNPVLVRDRYGHRNIEFHTSSNAETDKKLGEAIARLPENVYVPREPVKINTPSHVKELVDAEDGQNVGDIIKGKDGQWGQVVIDDNGERKLKPFAKSAQAKVGTLKELSDSLNDVLAKQVDPDVSEAALSKAREKLNKQYDSFVRKYGYINDKTNVRQISGSPIAGRLLALEQKYKAGTKGKESTAEKAPILTERTAYPATDDLNISTTSDALASSLRKFGFADIKYMASVLGKSENAIIKELGDKLFKDPVSEQYVPRDEYLSGNVRQKLAFAEDAARSEPEYARNVEALKAVIPADIEVEDIEIPLGSPILSVEDTQAFIDDLLGEPNAVVVRYNPVTTYWEVTTTPRYGRISAQAHEKYEIARVSYDDRDNVGINTVISKILNTGKIESSNFKVKDDDSETVRKARAAAEVKAQTIVKDINEKLKEWILKTPEVKQRVGQSYNNKFNAVVPRHYDGSLLTFPWLNTAADMTPRVHQADAVWRTINEKSVLYAHCVGSGKTLTMQAAGLELRRMGLANKIVYCVPKNVVRQFEREFYQVCPSAKILVLDSSTLPDNITSIHYDVKPKMELREDRNGKKKLVAVKDADGVPIFEKVKVSDEEAKKREVRLSKRNAALNQILTHDWDAIIMSHETFQRLPMSDEYMMQFRTEELEKYKRALAEEQAEERQAGKKSKSLKNIQEKIAKLEGKLNALIAKKQAKDFESPSLEDLGIDQLFVDEADTFKNLEVMTKYGQVKGISESAADRSFDMLMKTRYLLHSPNAHGVVFATGTPISNSVVELYTMCRYLNDDSLKRLGVDSFDQFAKMFIDIGQTEVPAQDGSGYEYKTAVRGLRNAPECINLFKEFADVKMVEDLPYIAAARPKAKRVAVAIEESAWNKRFKKDIRARVAAIKSSGRKDPPMINSKSKESKAHFAKTGEYLQVADSPLLVANDLKKASLAPFTVDDSLTGVEGYGKIWACADKIYEEWKDSSDRHGAQLVFCDQSIPDRSSNDPNAYDALKSRLIELGIPESDIAFVQDVKTDKAQAALFEAVNEGRVRVLIGSTQKMGAGTNMQHKLVALHHLDCPWRPRDIEQREGRILRQGNENKEVRIYNYVTKGTYDENLWDTVNTKKNVINQLMIGDKSTRNADTSDVDGDNFEALIELANADPDTKRYRQVMSQLTELESAKTTFEKSQELSKRVLVTAPELIDKFKAAIESVKDDMATLGKTSSAKFSMKIGQAVYENKIEANKAFSKEKEHVAKEFAKIAHKYGVDNAKFKDVKIASARGLDIYVSGNNPSFKAGFASEALTVYAKGKDSYGAATPTAIGVWNAMQTQPAAKLKGYETELKKNESELAEAKESQGDTFKDDEKIKSLREEQEELRKKIEEKAKRQRELDSIEPTPITLYESTSFGSYDLDADDPDIYEIENNIRDGLVLSMRENNTDTGTVSFDKPGSWDKFKKKFIDKTNWAVYSNENTIEITASKKDLNDLYEAIESQEETKYSFSQGGKRISPEEMTKQTLSVFPNAQNIETHDNGVSFDLPNGSHVEVNFTDDTISVDRAKAQKDYGGTLKGNEKASGKIEMVDKDALITLTMDSPDETISHEAMHLAWNLLTDRERNALLRTYGSEEEAAEGMREWKIRRKMKQGTIAGKIMQKISDMAHKLLSLFHENDQHVFQKLESGEMWERSNENNTAARNVKYKMNPLDEAEKYLKSHKDFGEKAGAYIDRTFRPGLAKAKANPNISVNETAKKKGWGVANTALNNTVRSPSRIKSPKTNYIWGLADTAQRELQELRGRWTHNFAGAIKNLNKEEKARYTDILWEEDMKQHVFSDEELREAGVSENVIKAHQKTRNLLGKIYNAVNAVYTSERVENFTYKTRKGAEKAQRELAKRPHTFVMHDIRETTKGGETVFQVSIKTRGYKEIHSVMTSEELSALSKDKDVYIKAREQMDDGSFKVSYLAYNKPLTNMEGYMPHIFHGVLIMKKYTDADGNVKSKVVGSADTIEKAVVKADAMQKEEGGEFIIAPKEFSSEGEVENPLLLGDMDYFKLMENLSKGASLTLDEAREMTHATMKGRHVYYGAKKHRKGAEGFEKNAIWAIQHHIDSSSRYVALDPFKQKAISFFERAFGDYNKDWTGEAAFCKGYIDSVLGKPSRLETLANDFLRLFPWFKNEARPARRMAGNLTGLTGVLKLGASLSSGFVNTLQLFNCVGYVGARKTAVGLKRALHPNAADKKILVASGVSEESGLALDSIGHITAEGTALSKVGNVINSVNNFLMKPFTLAEKTIRKATILAAYYKAIGDGLSKGEAIQYARDINRKVNFDYSVADAPRIFRALQGTVIGDMALQFQKYGVKEMEVISDFLPVLGNTTTKQKLEFFIPYLLVSGIWNAFPFEDALLSLLKLLGFDDPEKEAKRAMMEWAGNNADRKALVNVANYGAGAIVGVDISQRVGLKGVVPETSNIVTGGPLGSTTVQLAKAVLNGDANGAMKAISPAAGNIYGAVAGYNTDSKGRKTVDYDTRDRIVRGLGFRTIKEANATDAQSIVYNYKEQKKNNRAKAKSEYLKDPSSSNRQKLKEMGYSDKEIKALKDDKKSTRVERSQVGLSKDDKKKLKPVFDYVQ